MVINYQIGTHGPRYTVRGDLKTGFILFSVVLEPHSKKFIDTGNRYRTALDAHRELKKLFPGISASSRAEW